MPNKQESHNYIPPDFGSERYRKAWGRDIRLLVYPTHLPSPHTPPGPPAQRAMWLARKSGSPKNTPLEPQERVRHYSDLSRHEHRAQRDRESVLMG